MRPTEPVTQLDNGVVRCDVCQWRCEVAPEEYGRCLVRRNDNGVLMTLNDGLLSQATIGPVEDYGFLHFFPESRVFALGSFGTPFPREQDADHYGLLPGEDQQRRVLDAERAAQFAQERLCRGMIWSYNDPVMELEYLSEGVRYGKAVSRYTGIVTGGYWTIEALDLIGHYLDGINLRMFGFSDQSYAELAGVPQWRDILPAAERAVKHWHCHLEITLVLQPGVNDSPEELQALATWIGGSISPLTPVHVVPAGQPAAAAVVQARKTLLAAGLKFVYGFERTETTRCASCGFPVIERGERPRLVGVEEGRCDNCGADLNLRLSIHKRR